MEASFFIYALILVDVSLKLNEVVNEMEVSNLVKMTIPTKNNISIEKGAIVLSVSDYEEKADMHLITLGDIYLTIDIASTKNTVNINKENKKLATLNIESGDLDVVINWENNNLWINVFSKEIIPNYMGTSELVETTKIFSNYISLFERNHFNGVYESFTSYNNTLNQTDIGPFSLEVFKETTEILFDADFKQATHYKKDVVIEDTFAPRDGSPILLEDDKGPLRRQYLFDDVTGEYHNEVVERFLFKGERELNLSYANIEPSYKIELEFKEPVRAIYHRDNGIRMDGQTLYLEISEEEREELYGYEYTVTYQLERSYNVEFNEDVPHDGFRLNLVNMKAEEDDFGFYSSTENIKLTREGNRFEQEYLAKEIELNPLVNPQVQGFMYIDNKPQETNAFRISVSSQYLVGNGIDSASIMIEAIDDEGNEVLSPYLSVFIMDDKGKVFSNFGKIEPIIGYNSMKARNTSGRAYYELTAPILIQDTKITNKIYVVVYDRKSKISAQYPFYIRSVNNEQVYESTSESNNYLEIPFEYFARYFERELDIENPMRYFDKNKNHRLDRSDMGLFQSKEKDKNTIIAITDELLSIEETERLETKEILNILLGGNNNE